MLTTDIKSTEEAELEPVKKHLCELDNKIKSLFTGDSAHLVVGISNKYHFHCTNGEYREERSFNYIVEPVSLIDIFAEYLTNYYDFTINEAENKISVKAEFKFFQSCDESKEVTIEWRDK